MAEKRIKIIYDVETVDIEKADAVFNRIAKSTNKADKEVNNLSRDGKKAGQDTANSLRKASGEADKLSKSTKASQFAMNQLGGVASKVGGMVAGAFAVSSLISFGSSVINITKEFQKFEAVLTNTLGSSSAAQIALIKIQDFAAKTPFSVSELTESFVKLANQGFIPTTNQLRQLGDLASSTGKSFDQLTEAIIDAQTGEFERLKEFGIRAQKEGDKVTFTFKNVKTQVDFTNDSIQKYILGLGNLQGVTGSMAAVSQTLGGQISNLGDSYDQLLVTMGNKSTGVFSSIVSGLSDVLTAFNRFMKGAEQLEKESHLKNIGREVEELSGRYAQLVEDAKKYQKLDETGAKISAYNQLAEEFQFLIKVRQEEIDLIIKEGDEQVITDKKILESQDKRYKEAKRGLELAQAQLEALEKLRTKETEVAENQLGLLEKLRKELKQVTEEREKSTSEKEIKGYNKRAKILQAEIDRLLGVGKAAERAKIALERLASVDLETGLTEYGKKVQSALEGVYKKIYGEQVSGAKESSEANQKASDIFLENVGKEIEARATQYEIEETQRQFRKQREKEEYERRVELVESYTSATQDLYSSLVNYQNQLDDQRFQRLTANKEKELAAAGDNAKERNRIELQYDEKVRTLRRRQAEREKRLAIFNAIINVAQGVTKAISQGGIAGAILGALVAAAGAVQIAAISSQQVPAYAKGTKSVPGKGSKDSEPAMLTPGEMVIPVATKKKYSPILNAIFDHKIDPKILNDIVNGKTGGSQAVVINDNKEVVEQLKKIEVNKFLWDEEGFTRYQERGNSKIKYLNKRLSSQR